MESRGSNNSGQKWFSTTPLHHAKKFHLKLYEKERKNNIERSTSSTTQERLKGCMLIVKKM